MLEAIISLALLVALAGGAYWLWKKRQPKKTLPQTGTSKPNPDGTGGPGEPDPPNGP